jgi:hypothetical protein
MPQRTIRFSETTLKQIRQAARKNGSTSTAIVRHAVEQGSYRQRGGSRAAHRRHPRSDPGRFVTNATGPANPVCIRRYPRQSVGDRFTGAVVCFGGQGEGALRTLLEEHGGNHAQRLASTVAAQRGAMTSGAITRAVGQQGAATNRVLKWGQPAPDSSPPNGVRDVGP